MANIPQYYVRKSSTNYDLFNFIFEKEGNASVDQVPFSVSKDNADNLSIGDDVSIGYMDGAAFVPVFSGDIVSKDVNEIGDYILESYGGRLNREEHFSEIYTDKSPEYIAEDIIDTYVTSLTYASTDTSGITIARFIVKDETPAEAISRLAELLDWQLRTDNDKNFYFESVGITANPTNITIGDNGVVVVPWREIPGTIINALTFKGGSATFNTTESFTATSLQTEFTVTNKIHGTVKVTDNGTEVVGGVEGSIDTYDYTIDSENSKIVFETGIVSGHTIVINYNYEVPIKITARNDDSITANGIFSRKITDETIITMADARKRVGNILANYSELSVSGSVQVPYNSDYDVGETVQVIDAFNNIDRQLIIKKLILEYPEGIKTIELGTPSITQYDWQKNTDDRLRKLEQKQDNSDKIQKYLAFKESININNRVGRIRLRTDTIGNSWIVGSSTNGIVGTNTGTQGGGQQVVGADSRVETIVEVLNYADIMYERFNFDKYIDTGNTTASLDTTNEKVDFTTSEVLTSLSVAKGSTITSATLTCDNTTNITFEMSADGGSNWESITSGTLHTFTNTGSDLRYRVTASGTAVANQIKISY